MPAPTPALTGAKVFTMGQRLFHRGTPPMATYGNYYVAFPYLRLSGKWLQQCGFEIGQQVTVSYQPGRLVITLAGADAPATLV